MDVLAPNVSLGYLGSVLHSLYGPEAQEGNRSFFTKLKDACHALIFGRTLNTCEAQKFIQQNQDTPSQAKSLYERVITVRIESDPGWIKLQRYNDAILNSAQEVVLSRGDVGLGFNIRGGTDQRVPLLDSHGYQHPGIHISKIRDGGAAQNSNLSVGDYILAVNGHDFTAVEHNTAVELFKSAGDEVTIKYCTHQSAIDTFRYVFPDVFIGE
ncbi:PDZ domain-containing protein [Endozoicomonas sp.]|uniref:PDZ domain-containing protein n=1 Tax=Endozoicomonas sp. TaxID=1892382 RepID=UPI003AF6CCD8